jgi:hypothetical protein
MFGSEVLDVAIGIIFVFLLVSLIASAVREGIEAWMKTRASHLEAGIRELLHDRTGSGLAKQFFQHPLIYSLYSGDYTVRKLNWVALRHGGNLPSYIPTRNFALALMDMAARGPDVNASTSDANSGVLTLDTIRANVALIQNPPVQRALLTAIDSAQGDLQKAQGTLEAWYDSAMDRVSGKYKRATQWILFVTGLAIAVMMNVNAFVVADHLYREKSTRDAIVARAQIATDPDYEHKKYGEIKAELNLLTLPLGGSRRNDLKTRPFETIGGWLLVGIAASFGAPFWFDLLNKVMVIRSTVKPHEKSPEESSEDRRLGGPPTTAINSSPPPQITTPAAPAADSSMTPSSADLIDGCDVQTTTVTKDEDLPPAQGGVR